MSDKAPEQGLRFDQGKLRLDLIPPEVMLYLGRVFTHGAGKYGDNNWLKGMDWHRMIGAAKRHFLKWELGQMYDTDSGEPNLALAAWNILGLLVYEQRNIGKDDRQETAIPYDAIDDYFKVESKPRREETLRDLGYEDLPEASKAALDTLGVEAGVAQAEESASPVEVAASPVTTTAPCPCRACNPQYIKTNHK
jgi:hypothetical protein